MSTPFQEVIRQLQKQKAAIDRALTALQEVDEEPGAQPAAPRRGRPKKVLTAAGPAKKAAKKRTLSPEARKRISDAVKKRWAATKKAAKKNAAK